MNKRSHSRDDLNAEFDELLAQMQTPLAQTGVEAAFNASPEKLGRAAVMAAPKHRAPRKRTRRISTTTRT